MFPLFVPRVSCRVDKAPRRCRDGQFSGSGHAECIIDCRHLLATDSILQSACRLQQKVVKSVLQSNIANNDVCYYKVMKRDVGMSGLAHFEA